MALRERHSRSGLQVLLERKGASLVGELYDDVEEPGSVPGGAVATVAVVLGEASSHIRREAGVVLRGIVAVPENVDVEF
jgi:hypothetical protein